MKWFWDHLGRILESPGGDLGIILRLCWDSYGAHFRVVLGWSGHRFAIMLGSFEVGTILGSVGAILGSVWRHVGSCYLIYTLSPQSSFSILHKNAIKCVSGKFGRRDPHLKIKTRPPKNFQGTFVWKRLLGSFRLEAFCWIRQPPWGEASIGHRICFEKFLNASRHLQTHPGASKLI